MASDCAYKPKNPLPYRRLKEYVNGIWDETRKEFYPYIVSTGTVAAKRGIRYFVHSVAFSNANSGDKNNTCDYLTCTIRRSNYLVGFCMTGATTAASGSSSQNSNFQVLNVLVDENSAMTFTQQSATRYQLVVYAEIPDDPAGGPVVVT